MDISIPRIHVLAFQVTPGAYPYSPDEIAPEMALVAAWPEGEGTSPFLERRIWRRKTSGPVSEFLIFGLKDSVGVLSPAAARSELEERARPLQAAHAMARTRVSALAIPTGAIGSVTEMTEIHHVIPEGVPALGPLFAELVRGLEQLRGSVGLSLRIATATNDGTFAEPADDELRDVAFAMRIFSRHPLPATLRARAQAICLSRRARSDDWETAQHPADVALAVDSICRFDAAEFAQATRPHLAALTFGLPLASSAKGKVGRPFDGALSRDGAAVGKVSCVDGRARPFRLSWSTRAHHMALFGSTGAGKTTQILRILLDDVQARRSVILVDPHGDLARALAEHIPPDRLVYADPRSGRSAPLSFLDTTAERASAHLASAFSEVWPASWVGPAGERGILEAVTAVYASSHPEARRTVPSVLRFVADSGFRKQVIEAIEDGHLKRRAQLATRAWHHTPSDTDHPFTEWLAAKLTPLGEGSARVLFDRESDATLEQQIADGKVIIAALPIGVLGEASTRIVSRMMLTRITTAIASQGSLPVGKRQPISVVVDEAHLCVGAALRGLFSQARKFNASVTVATQTPSQFGQGLDEVLTNVQTALVGRLSRREAGHLADRLGMDAVTALPRLARFHMLLSLADTDPDLAPYVLTPLPAPREPEIACNRDIVYAPPANDERADVVVVESGSAPTPAAGEVPEPQPATTPDAFEALLNDFVR